MTSPWDRRGDQLRRRRALAILTLAVLVTALAVWAVVTGWQPPTMN